MKQLLARAGVATFTIALCTSVAIPQGYAQPQVPTYVQPGQLEKRFERDSNSPAPSSVQAPTPTLPPMSKEAKERLAKQRFTLKSVAVEGSTIYPAGTFNYVYQDKIGKQISMLDATLMARQITDHYRKDGYILSQAIVPAQSLDGSLSIRVTEGYISRVVIQGDRRDSYRTILDHYGENLTKKRPVNIADMERYMLLMDDLPGATAKGVVRPSATPGSAELVVDMFHKPFEASYNINNRGSKYVGPIQHSAIVSANSLFNMYDRTTLRYVTTSPTTELRFIDLQHEEQLGSEGTRLVLTASHSDSAPGDALKSLDIRSSSNFFQAKVLHPFQRSRQENLTVRGIFDARNTENDVFAVVDSSKERLRSIRGGVAYDFADSLSGVNLIDFEISQGLNIWNESDNNGVQPARAGAESDYTKVNLDITRTQALPSNFSLFASATSQYSFSKLMSAEQFSLGGAAFGQAYDPAEIAGDHGVAGKFELRYGQAVGEPWLNSYQAYGFYDIGRTWFKAAGPGGNDKLSLASAGIGLRTNINQHFSGDVQVAVPLTREVNNQGNHGDDPRFFFNLTGRF